jgi:hypothetical protein
MTREQPDPPGRNVAAGPPDNVAVDTNRPWFRRRGVGVAGASFFPDARRRDRVDRASAGGRLSEWIPLPYLAPVTDTSPWTALRHRAGWCHCDGGDLTCEVLVAAASTDTDSRATLAHPTRRRVAPATPHSAGFLLATSDPNACGVPRGSSKVLTPSAARPLPGNTRGQTDQESRSVVRDPHLAWPSWT